MERRCLEGTSALDYLIILRRHDRSAERYGDQTVRDITGLSLTLTVTMATFRAIYLVTLRIQCQTGLGPALLHDEVGLRVRDSYQDRARVTATRARSAM